MPEVRDNAYWLQQMKEDAAKRKASGGGGRKGPLKVGDLGDQDEPANYSDTRVLPSSAPAPAPVDPDTDSNPSDDVFHDVDLHEVDGRKSKASSRRSSGDLFTTPPPFTEDLSAAPQASGQLNGGSHHASRYLTIVTTEHPDHLAPAPVAKVPAPGVGATDGTPLLTVPPPDTRGVPNQPDQKPPSKLKKLWNSCRGWC